MKSSINVIILSNFDNNYNQNMLKMSINMMNISINDIYNLISLPKLFQS